MVHLVRGLGRINGWSHDYWRDIGWAEFWASVTETEMFTEATTAQQPDRTEDPLAAFEASVAAATGMRSPL